MNEPRSKMQDPHSCDYCPEPQESGDEFDRFLRLTGGDPAPRGGHAAAAKAHAAKVDTGPYEGYPTAYAKPGILGPVANPTSSGDEFNPTPAPKEIKPSA